MALTLCLTLNCIDITQSEPPIFHYLQLDTLKSKEQEKIRCCWPKEQEDVKTWPTGDKPISNSRVELKQVKNKLEI